MSFWKKNQIRFDGKKEVETRLKNQTDNVISRRFKILMVGVAIGGAILLIRLFMTQIGQKIIMQLNFLNTIQVYLQVILLEEIFMIEIITDLSIIKISIVQHIMLLRIFNLKKLRLLLIF